MLFRSFSECAAFLSQISQTAQNNPYGVQQLAKRLTKIDPSIRDQFIATTNSVAQRSGHLAGSAVEPNATQADKPPVAKKIATLSANPSKVSGSELSTRRQDTATAQPLEERVDSPTILLINQADESKAKKP